MKHFLLFAITAFCLLVFPMKAQIVITSADLPGIGTQIVRAVDTITPVLPGNAGLNQVWNLSNLVASRYDTVIIMPVE